MKKYKSDLRRNKALCAASKKKRMFNIQSEEHASSKLKKYKLLKPKPLKLQKSKDNNEPRISDDEIEDYCEKDQKNGFVDFKKVMKESTTFNSPDKYIRKKLAKRKEKVENETFIDENEIAAGYLQDIMMASSQENMLADDYLNLNENTFQFTGESACNEGNVSFDVSELDEYLSGTNGSLFDETFTEWNMNRGTQSNSDKKAKEGGKTQSKDKSTNSSKIALRKTKNERTKPKQKEIKETNAKQCNTQEPALDNVTESAKNRIDSKLEEKYRAGLEKGEGLTEATNLPTEFRPCQNINNVEDCATSSVELHLKERGNIAITSYMGQSRPLALETESDTVLQIDFEEIRQTNFDSKNNNKYDLAQNAASPIENSVTLDSPIVLAEKGGNTEIQLIGISGKGENENNIPADKKEKRNIKKATKTRKNKSRRNK